MEGRADGQSGVAGIDRDEHVVEQPGPFGQRVDRRVIEEAPGEAEIGGLCSRAHARQEVDEHVAELSLQRRGERRAAGNVVAAPGGQPRFDGGFQTWRQAQRIILGGDESAHPCIARIGCEPRERLEPLFAGGMKSHRAREPGIDVGESWTVPRPVDTRQRIAQALPDADLRRVTIAHDDRRRSKRRRKVGGAGMREMIIQVLEPVLPLGWPLVPATT